MTASLARRSLVAAILLGIVGDALVDNEVLRLGFALWVLLVAATALWIGRSAPSAADPSSVPGRDREILLAVVALAGLSYVFHDAEMILLLNTFVGFAAAALVVWRARGRALRDARLGDGLVAGVAMGLTLLTGAPRLALRDAAWDDAASPARRRFRFLVIGGIAALPLLLITAALLGEADPIFGALIETLSRLVSEELLQHTLIVSFIAWAVAGWLRGGLTPDLAGAEDRLPSLARVPMVGLAPALYAMIVLLAAFLGLQARTLFGGAAFVDATTGLTYAAYARGGFFELVAVSFLVLILLLVADALLDRNEEGSERRFRSSALVLVGLVAVLGASAVHRMLLYVDAYGLTEQRLYALAGMVGIVATLAWFCVSVLGGRRERFTFGLATIAVGWIFALNLLTPDALVARVNLARAVGGKSFDVAYHSLLSADAFPTLVRGASSLPREYCVPMQRALRERTFAETERWADWNLPMARVQVSRTPGSALQGEAYCPQE